MNKFNYENTEIVAQKGGKVVRKVSIKKGRGYKMITKYHRGKKLYTVKKPIHSSHIKLIKKGKFIPGLFKDCKNCKTKKRRGGNDIEMGPDVEPVDTYPVPPDPERFKQQELNMVRESLKPIKPTIAENFFAGPTPEQRTVIESNTMIDEDPRFKEPFQREELQIFTRGGKRRRITRRKYGGKRNRITRRKRGGRKGGDTSAKPNNNMLENVDSNIDYDSEGDWSDETGTQDNMSNDNMSDDNMSEDNMSEDNMSNDDWSEEDMAQLREIRNLINQNNERFQEIDDELYEIEQMSEEEKDHNREEELHREMEDYARRDQELSTRLRNLYTNRR